MITPNMQHEVSSQCGKACTLNYPTQMRRKVFLANNVLILLVRFLMCTMILVCGRI